MNRTALLDRTSTGKLEDLGQQLRVDSVGRAPLRLRHPTSSLSAADLWRAARPAFPLRLADTRPVTII
jgi:hypothetical protein